MRSKEKPVGTEGEAVGGDRMGNGLSEEARRALPKHVAIIMDGNGRWAKQRHLPRVEGHRMGAESVREVIETAGQIGIQYLTLYAFSVENWNRPKEEVGMLMKFLARYLKVEKALLDRNNVKLEAIGQLDRLPDFVRDELHRTQEALAKNTGLTLILALSYGGRTELVDAIRSIAREVQAGELDPETIDPEVVSRHLYTHRWPDPDLLIRTSGEMRVSNFLLWQISYAELVISDILWPDFRRAQFLAALEEFALRHRRFGGL